MTEPTNRRGIWRRNALILVPTLAFSLYVGIYIVAFPRHYWMGENASIRFCYYSWQGYVWDPCAYVEEKLRSGDFAFGIMPDHTGEADWPSRLWP